MNDINTENPITSFTRQNDFRIGKPESNKHPLDEINDAELRGILKESELAEDAISKAIGLKGKFRDLLMGIVEAGRKGDTIALNIMADNLSVGMGLNDPRKSADDPPVSENEIPAHAKRAWFNG